MKTMKFKTNINCGSCVRGVTPSLDEHPGIKDWRVDLEHDDRILTVQTEDKLTEAEVAAAVADAGFEAQPVGSA
ncbi:MAG: cation transporter [Lewinella sp.]